MFGNFSFTHRAGGNRATLVTALVGTVEPQPSPTDATLDLLQQGVEAIKAHVVLPVQERLLDPLLGHSRLQQRQQLDLAPQRINGSNSTEKLAKEQLKTLSTMLVLATVGTLFLAPLNLVAGFWLAYFARSTFYAAYTDLFGKRHLSYNVLDAVVLGGLLLSGMVLPATIAGWFLFFRQWLVAKTEDRSQSDIISLFQQQPHSVWVRIDDLEVEIPFEQVTTDQIIVVTAGQMIPVDGTIVRGVAAIDQRALTGEAQPVEKALGERVLASTLVISGKIDVRVEKTGAETVTAQIGQMLVNTADFRDALRSQTEVMVNRITPVILTLGVVACPLIGVSRAIGVLWSTPGYNMLYFGPISMLSFLHIASQKGVLVKDGRSLDQLQTIDTVIFDKTGTLTAEQPSVSHIHRCGQLSENDLLRLAAAAEAKQTHPVALAILHAAEEQALSMPPVDDDIHYAIGYGLRVQIEGQTVRVGSARFMQMEDIEIPAAIGTMEAESHAQGCSVIMVAVEDALVGAIELAPTIRPEAKAVIRSLKERGLDLYIISGDHTTPTQHLAAALGIDNYFAEVLPEDKANLVAELQAAGRAVCFVGDGINDAIALKKADVSISLRGATTIATDTAQIVLVEESLRDLPTVFALADEFSANMRINFLAATVPTTITLLGSLFFGWGALGVILFTQLSTPLALYNSLRPLLASSKRKVPTKN